MVPITRSAKGFCQGERGAVSTSAMRMPFTRRTPLAHRPVSGSSFGKRQAAGRQRFLQHRRIPPDVPDAIHHEALQLRPPESEGKDPRAGEPGWYFDAVDVDSSWINNDPNGPYESLADAREDLRTGQDSIP